MVEQYKVYLENYRDSYIKEYNTRTVKKIESLLKNVCVPISSLRKSLKNEVTDGHIYETQVGSAFIVDITSLYANKDPYRVFIKENDEIKQLQFNMIPHNGFVNPIIHLLLGKNTLYGETAPLQFKDIDRIRNELETAFPDAKIDIYCRSVTTYDNSWVSWFLNKQRINTIEKAYIYFAVYYSLKAIEDK